MIDVSSVTDEIGAVVFVVVVIGLAVLFVYQLIGAIRAIKDSF